MSRRIRRNRWIRRALGLVFLVAALGAYHWVLRPSAVQSLLQTAVADFTEADLKLKVEYASPLFGLRLSDIDLRDRRSDVPIFQARELKLRWFLPGFLTGHAGLRELSLVQSRITLRENENGNWNYEALTGPSAESAAEEEVAPAADELRLYLPFKFFAYLNIRDLTFDLKSKDTEMLLSGVHLRTGFVTKTMTRLPLTTELLEKFDALAFVAGEEKTWLLKLNTPDGSIAGPIPLNLFLHRDTDLSEADLSSRLRLNTDRLFLSRAGKDQSPLGLNLAYDINFDAEQDRLAIPRLRIGFRGKPWISLKGEMSGATSRDRWLRLTLGESNLNLTALGQVLQRLPGLSVPELAGNIQLSRTTAEGPLEKLAIKGKLGASDVKIDRKYHFSEVRADLTGAVDLYKIFSFLKPPSGYDPDRRLAFGIIHRLRAPDLFAVFNGGRINADAVILPETGIKATATLERFPLEFFTAPDLSGRLGAELDFVSDENFEVIKLDGVARLDGARYVIDRSRSSPQNAKVLLDGRIRLIEDAVLLDLENLDLTVRNVAGNQFLHMLGDLGLRFDDGMVMNLDARKLSVDYPILRPTLPGLLQYQLTPYRRYLSKGVELASKLDLSLYDTTTVAGTALIKVPFLNLEDLNAQVDMTIADTFMNIRKLELTGLRQALRASVKGEMRTDAKGLWRPRLEAALSLAREKRTRIHPNITMRGRLHMTVNAQPATTRGDLAIDNFDINYRGDRPRKGDATNHPLEIEVRDVHLKLPFTHDLHIAKPRRLNERAGALFVRNYGFHRTPNLRVRHVSSSHNPRGQYKKNRYYYLGGPKRPGLLARLIYEKNVLLFPWLEALVLHGASGEKNGAGAINGRNMYFNLADLETKNMEYGADLQIQDLDLEPYLPFSRGNYDGRISADLRLRGRDLDKPLRTMDARLSVYRLSPEFSGFATRLVMPERLMAGIVNNTVSIPSIRVELKEGLVYSSVTMSRGGLGGLLVKPARQELKQERVPLAQFTARSRRVVNEFGERGPGLTAEVGSPTVNPDSDASKAELN